MIKSVKKIIDSILFCIVTAIRLTINQIEYFIIISKEEKLFLKNQKAYDRYVNLKNKKYEKTITIFRHIKEINTEPVIYISK